MLGRTPFQPPALPPLPLQSHATRQLPGSKPELLGVAPAVFVLLQGNPQRARPAGALLLQVQAAPGPLGSRQHGGELHGEGSQRMLRVLVSSPGWAGRREPGLATPAGVLAAAAGPPSSAQPCATAHLPLRPQEAAASAAARAHGLAPFPRLFPDPQVYCPESGALLERRDWLLRQEHQLEEHPFLGLPCWDSG